MLFAAFDKGDFLGEMLNLLLAWLSAFVMLLLSALYPLRLIRQRRRLPPGHWIAKLHRCLRRAHKPLGIGAIGLIFLHCRFSSQRLGLNTGSFCLAMALLLLLSYVLRKRLKNWLGLHRGLTLVLWLGLGLHILLTRLF